MSDYQPSLANLARKAGERGVLLASLIDPYLQQAGPGAQDLTLRLACTPDQLVHLRLCDVPRPDHFEEDLTQIAEHIGIAKEALNNFVREMIDAKESD